MACVLARGLWAALQGQLQRTLRFRLCSASMDCPEESYRETYVAAGRARMAHCSLASLVVAFPRLSSSSNHVKGRLRRARRQARHVAAAASLQRQPGRAVSVQYAARFGSQVQHPKAPVLPVCKPVLHRQRGFVAVTRLGKDAPEQLCRQVGVAELCGLVVGHDGPAAEGGKGRTRSALCSTHNQCWEWCASSGC